MRAVTRFCLLLLLLPFVASCVDKDSSDTYPFETAPTKHRLNLVRLLGEQVTLLSDEDTLHLAVRFERPTRTSLVLNARTGDTLLRGWVTRYRGLYYFTEPVNDSSHWVHAWRRTGSTVQGLTDDWAQMLALRYAADRGELPAELVRLALRADTTLTKRLRYDAAQLRPFFEALVDSCPRYRLQPTERAAPAITAPARLISSVYPNPAHGQVTVELVRAAEYSLELLNARGQRLRQQRVQTATASLDLAQLPTGTYLVRVQDVHNSQQSVQKLVVE